MAGEKKKNNKRRCHVLGWPTYTFSGDILDVKGVFTIKWRLGKAVEEKSWVLLYREEPHKALKHSG